MLVSGIVAVVKDAKDVGLDTSWNTLVKDICGRVFQQLKEFVCSKPSYIRHLYDTRSALPLDVTAFVDGFVSTVGPAGRLLCVVVTVRTVLFTAGQSTCSAANVGHAMSRLSAFFHRIKNTNSL